MRPAYPNYTPSEFEWLGDVPSHWKVIRGRFCMNVNPRSNRIRTLSLEDEVSFIPMEAVGEYGGLALDLVRTIADIGAGYTEFEDGDVIAAKITPCFENGKGALAAGLRNGAAFGTTELHVLRATPTLDPRFLFYLSISLPFRGLGEGTMYGAGGQKRVPPDFCKDFPVLLPPLPEQRQIADFLDLESAGITALVEKNRSLINRLMEKRRSLISHTVTRGLPLEIALAVGLSPQTRFRPSGISWVGDIPENWEALQLRRVTRFITSGSRGWAQYYSDDGAMFIRIGNLTRGSIGINLNDIQHVDPPEGAEGERTRVSAGDVLFSITAYLGSVGVADEAIAGAYINQHIALVRLNTERVNPRFVAYAALADVGQAQLVEQGYGGTKIQLSLDDVKSLWLPVPPLAEQHAIVEFLSSEIEKIDHVIAKVERTIERLQEYRRVLIAEVVTGKVDVREVHS